MGKKEEEMEVGHVMYIVRHVTCQLSARQTFRSLLYI